ncbi:MAG: hypothetical protein ACYDH5_18960 [Acidimicrobiales bacterium]
MPHLGHKVPGERSGRAAALLAALATVAAGVANLAGLYQSLAWALLALLGVGSVVSASVLGVMFVTERQWANARGGGVESHRPEDEPRSGELSAWSGRGTNRFLQVACAVACLLLLVSLATTLAGLALHVARLGAPGQARPLLALAGLLAVEVITLLTSTTVRARSVPPGWACAARSAGAGSTCPSAALPGRRLSVSGRWAQALGPA